MADPSNAKRLLTVARGFVALAACLVMSAGAAVADEQPVDTLEKEIRAFEPKDREEPLEQGSVLFLGSSSIRLWDTANAFPEVRSVNRGFGGSQIVDSIHYAGRIAIPYKPRLIVFYAGDNDIAAGKSPEEVVND